MPRRRRPKIPSEIVTVTIEKLSHEAKGIAHVDEKTVFVSGALPGEKVSIKFTAKFKGVYAAEVVEVFEASPDRVEPPCEFFSRCGGCSLQHLDVDKQILVKQDVFLDNMKHIGKLEVNELLPTLSGSNLGYRTKARLGVRYVTKKQKLLIGFREKSSNFLCEMESCLVLHPSIGMRLRHLASLIESLSITIKIPQVEVAIGDTQGALIFRHLEEFTTEDEEKLIHFGQTTGFYILAQPGGPDTINYLYPRREALGSSLDKALSLSYYLPEFDLHNYFLPTDFTQVNRIINRQMVELALSLLEPQVTDNILDLFCGMGNFTLPLARKSKQVTGVEGNHDLVIRAGQNATENLIDNVNFVCTDLFKNEGDDDFRKQNWAKQVYDRILIDPARSGAKEVMQHIAVFKAHTIVYVSCNPATLARDSDILVHEQGYELIKAGVMDMFPHTAHVESIALFKKA